MRDDKPRVIAHRGFAGVAPENTLAAFDAVGDGRHPADMIEFDVMPSADGDVMVFHDLRLDGRSKPGSRGITNGQGVVWEKTTDELQSTEILDSGETIPTLAAVLETVPESVGLNVELRNPGTFDIRFGESLESSRLARQREQWDPFVDDVLSELDGSNHEVLFSSFSEAALASAADFAPAIPRGVNIHDSMEDGLEIADRHDCAAVHPRRNMIKGTPYFETSYGSVSDPDFGGFDLMAAADDRGLAVNVWTLKTWRHAAVFMEAGVDALIADYPHLRTLGEPFRK